MAGVGGRAAERLVKACAIAGRGSDTDDGKLCHDAIRPRVARRLS